MKIYVIFDTDGCVYAAYRNRDDAVNHLYQLHDKIAASPNFSGVGIAKNHLWWESDCEEQHVIMKEVELR